MTFKKRVCKSVALALVTVTLSSSGLSSVYATACAGSVVKYVGEISLLINDYNKL